MDNERIKKVILEVIVLRDQAPYEVKHNFAVALVELSNALTFLTTKPCSSCSGTGGQWGFCGICAGTGRVSAATLP